MFVASQLSTSCLGLILLLPPSRCRLFLCRDSGEEKEPPPLAAQASPDWQPPPAQLPRPPLAAGAVGKAWACHAPPFRLRPHRRSLLGGGGKRDGAGTDIAFSSRHTSSIGDRLFYGSGDVALAKYGEVWRQIRRICVVHLLSHTRVRSFQSVRAEEAAHLVNGIRAVAGRPVKLSEMVVTTTCDMICRVAFGKKYPVEETGGCRAVLALLSEISAEMTSLSVRDYVPWLGWIDWLSGLDARVRNTSVKIDKLLEKVLEEHESRTSGDCSTNNILDILLSLGGSQDDGGFSLSRDRIKAVTWDMFGGGTDTTYVTIDWAMSELIKNPRAKKGQEEIRRAVGLEKVISEEAPERMEYLKAVIKETLRLHPPFPLLLPRETVDVTPQDSPSLRTRQTMDLQDPTDPGYNARRQITQTMKSI